MESFWLLFLPWAIAVVLLNVGLFYFTDDSCLPYKRKIEKMLDEILSYQRKNETCGIEFQYKGKQFNVEVKWSGSTYRYGYYSIYINGNHVMTWHILSHLYTKSRLEEHHGDMRQYEELEIIKAAYKYAKKANKESFDKKWDKTSYFN